MIKVAICGALGRMGMTIGGLVDAELDMELIGGIDVRKGEFYGVPVFGSSEIDGFLDEFRPDVLIDFTVADAAVKNILAGARHGIAMVIGTTGFSDIQRDEINNAVSGTVPAVISSNYSVGMNIFWRLIREAAHQLKDYDIEIIEAHHRYKKDAPSGTAKTILSLIKEETGDLNEMYGRVGMMERGAEIGIHVVRAGDIVGDHTVLFAGNHETIEISHRAYDRAVFAHGVIRAIRYVNGKNPGLYSMDDILGFSTDLR